MTTVEQTTIRAAVRDGIARGVAAIGLAGEALIHLLDLPGQLSDTPYMFFLEGSLVILGSGVLLSRRVPGERRVLRAANAVEIA
jgi:hypothetical protein